MRNSYLQNGEKVLVVNIRHLVKKSDFATALADKFYIAKEDFKQDITKKQAEDILKDSLFFHGLQGAFEDGYFESSYEECERYNAIYSLTLDWVKQKYKWLADDLI